MSLTANELSAIKERADNTIKDGENEDAARIAADVLMLLLALKMEKEKK